MSFNFNFDKSSANELVVPSTTLLTSTTVGFSNKEKATSFSFELQQPNNIEVPLSEDTGLLVLPQRRARGTAAATATATSVKTSSSASSSSSSSKGSMKKRFGGGIGLGGGLEININVVNENYVGGGGENA